MLSIPVVLYVDIQTNSDEDLSGATTRMITTIATVVIIWKRAERLLNHPYDSMLARFFNAKDKRHPYAIATITPLESLTSPSVANCTVA